MTIAVVVMMGYAICTPSDTRKVVQRELCNPFSEDFAIGVRRMHDWSNMDTVGLGLLESQTSKKNLTRMRSSNLEREFYDMAYIVRNSGAASTSCLS